MKEIEKMTLEEIIEYLFKTYKYDDIRKAITKYIHKGA
jgi:hypothetical protein